MTETAEFDRSLNQNVNAVLSRGSLVAAGLGFGAGAIVLTLHALGTLQNLLLPGVGALVCGGYAFGFHLLAHFNLLRRRMLYATFIPFVMLPTAMFAVFEVVLPAGAASFITGPLSHLYVVMIVLTAFTFEPALSYVAGALSAAGYLGIFFVTRGHLEQLSGPDPTLVQDLQAAPVYMVKGLMMLTVGGLAGALSAFARRMVGRLVEEHRQADTLSRLFGEYVSTEVRERLTRSEVVKGERREVALLFSDIRDFTTWSETRPAEEIIEQLNVYFDRMVAAITRNGGVVDKFIGDAVMGVFGGLRELDNPAASAFAAAREMREALAALNQERIARGLPALHNGVGLHFGEVVQGPLGSARRRDFTVIGDAVNTASRIEGLCKQFGQPLVLSEATHRRLPPAMQAACSSLGEVQVKGRREGCTSTARSPGT
ncbi:MAG: adenylate/guanylate cyclase domain-containing protein [Myxococcaceae bacterium]